MLTRSPRRLSDAAIAFAKGRGITTETLSDLRVHSAIEYLPGLKRKVECLIFPYRGDDWKARAIESKDFATNKGFELEFWGIEDFLDGNAEIVYIVEGELDRCALVEAGLRPCEVLSVPNGARARPSEAPNLAEHYAYVHQGLASGLRRAQRFVWCGDSDAPGLALRADMVRLFGAAKFAFVTWPDGIKDANDMLLKDGRDGLRDLVVNGNLEWPVVGLFKMSQLPEPVPLETWSTGFPGWDSRVKLAPRTLSVVTGQPGSGKTLIWAQIWAQVVGAYGLRACIASFETSAKPHLRRQLRRLQVEDGRPEERMSDREKASADRWIDEHYWWLVEPQRRPTLEWFLDTAEVAVTRRGCSIVQLDPWNRLEAGRAPGEQQQEYIEKTLRELYNFATAFECHVQIIAHPSKTEAFQRKHAPVLEDIAGSKAWEAMPDQGFVVHRPKLWEGAVRRTDAKFIHAKTRFEELGYPCSLDVEYYPDMGRYYARSPGRDDDAESDNQGNFSGL